MIANDYKGGVIVVHSMARSGTTLFCVWLKRKFNIPNAGEIFHTEHCGAQQSAQQAIEQANKEKTDFVCKYFPATSVFDSTRFYGRTKFYNVNLIRMDIAKQFTSLYIALKTDKWQTHGEGEFAKEFAVDHVRQNLDIDNDFIENEFKNFILQLKFKEEYDKTVKYDAVYIYEDIIDYLNENKPQGLPNVPSSKPSNYNRIYAHVVSLFRKYARSENDIPQIVREWDNNFTKHGYKQ